MMAPNADGAFLQKWSEFQGESPPLFYPDDVGYLDPGEHFLFQSFDEFKQECANLYHDRKKFHLGLVPVPFTGLVHSASVYILMNNPGFAPSDYKAEENPSFREALVENLKTGGRRNGYPFIYLNPEFSETGGFTYWEGKLADLRTALEQQRGLSYEGALAHLAHSIALIQSVPYHSAELSRTKKVNALPSVAEAKRFVHHYVVPRARAGEALLVIPRGKSYWQCREGGNVVVYSPGQARAASLSLRSRGGRAIAKRLGLNHD